MTLARAIATTSAMDTPFTPLTDLAALLADVIGQLRSMRDQLQRIEGRLALLPVAGAAAHADPVDHDRPRC